MIPALLAVAVLALATTPELSIDGKLYLQERPPRPFGARIGHRLLRLLPMVAWHALSVACVAFFLGAVAHRFGMWAGLLVAGLPLVRVALWLPFLTDQFALACFGALLIWPEAWWIALVGGCFSERMPVFGALAVGSPLPLLGLVPYGIGWLLAPHRARHHFPVNATEAWSWVEHPLAMGWKYRRRLLDPAVTVLPWGVLSLGVAGLSSPWQAVTLALGYAQLLVAHDAARLYQWAFVPLLAGLAALPIPEWAWPLLVLVHWFHPWRDRV